MTTERSKGFKAFQLYYAARKRFRPWWAENQWVVIGVAGLLVFGLAYLGFSKHYATISIKRTSFDLIFEALQLFRISSTVPPGPKPWELELARTLAAAITAIAAIKALMLLFRDKFRRIRLSRWSDHIVICGMGKKGAQLASDLLRQGEQVVIIEKEEKNSELEACEDSGAIALTGDAANLSLLKKARVDQARHVFIVSGDDKTNLEIALLVHQLMSRTASLPTADKQASGRSCFVHLIDLELRDLLAQHRVFAHSAGQISTTWFNIFENAARQLLLDYPPDVSAKAAGQETIHLLILGFGQMGQSIAVQAARIGHYANGSKVRITAVDRQAAKKGGIFLHKYPMFKQICDISFIELDLDDVSFLNGSFLDDHGGRNSITQALVCLEQEAAGLVCGLNLVQIFRGSNTPLFIRMSSDTQLINLLHYANAAKPGQDNESRRLLHTFGNIASCCASDVVINERLDLMARKIHAGYVRLKEQHGGNKATDPSMRDWDELNEGMKDSNRQQTEHIDIKLRAVGCKRIPLIGNESAGTIFSPDEVELLARMEHARWNAERFLAGWQHGEEKSIEEKISPYLVPYDNLAEEIKEYDRAVVRDLPMILSAIGEEIVRTNH